MDRRQNNDRSSENRAVRHGDKAVSPADACGVVQREPAPSDTGFPAPASATPNRYPVLAVCGFLLLAIALVFGQTLRHEFVNFDDDEYVYGNPQVSCGLDSPLKKGTGSEPTNEKPTEDNGREVPVSLFQRPVGAERILWAFTHT